MWDLLILTAASNHQAATFRKLIDKIDISEFCRAVEIIEDEPSGVRIGSGGSSLNVCQHLESSNPNSKILLIHSGGLSQRMPHLSARGKIFARLPGGRTVLETKLDGYRKLSSSLPPGLMITASDVLEDMSNLPSIIPECDVTIFAHQSSIEVAEQHGVFVLRGEKLECVLQKPSRELMEKHGACHNGSALTDSCFHVNWSVVRRLAEISQKTYPMTAELCCYGDFMRPMGTRPIIDYIDSSPKLQNVRKLLFELFSKTSPQIVNLGPDTFYHLGTCAEFLYHCSSKSTFCAKFGSNFSEESYIEKSELGSGKTGKSCIIVGSHVSSVPDQLMVFTYNLGAADRFVCFIFRIDDDMKKLGELVWNGRQTGLHGEFWNAKLFDEKKTKHEAFLDSMKRWNSEMVEPGKYSLADVVGLHDVDLE